MTYDPFSLHGRDECAMCGDLCLEWVQLRKIAVQ